MDFKKINNKFELDPFLLKQEQEQKRNLSEFIRREEQKRKFDHDIAFCDGEIANLKKMQLFLTDNDNDFSSNAYISKKIELLEARITGLMKERRLLI